VRVRCLICACLLFGALIGHAQSLKHFYDPQTSVSFSYPAAWSDGPDVLFYMGSAITTLTADGRPAAPRAKVGFVANTKSGPYAGTDLNGAEFIYNEIPEADAVACRKSLTSLGDDQSAQDTVTINGVTYDHNAGGEGGLGHGVSREIYATFRGGQCVLFEESIHSFDLSADEARQLNHEEIVQLWNQLNAVMSSVRFGAVQ
jgi:hypothetical protein